MDSGQQLSIFDPIFVSNFNLSTIHKNYPIREPIGIGSIKTKATNNIKAIELSKKLDAEGCPPTVEEQAILAQYLGWGIAPEIFEEPLKPDWQNLGIRLKQLLTPAEYRAARASIVNAYYTTPAIISEIHRGIRRLGFHGGRILEPSMGSGLWLGLSPDSICDRISGQVDSALRYSWTGVELDAITGRIAQQLYPEADIYVRGFEEVILPHNFFDASFGNVPFGTIVPNDPQYNKLPIKTLHDYFFCKALNLIRPGGLIVFITSVGTLQSKNGRKMRELLSKSANLVGAMRLPDTAFQQFANTSVTTDLVILQKREHPELEPDSLDWLEVCESGLIAEETGKPLMMPVYYQQHPEMLLGKLTVDKLYGGKNRLGLSGDGRDLPLAIRQAFSLLPAGIYNSQPLTSTTTPAPKSKSILIPASLQASTKPYNYVWHNNQPWQAIDGRLVPVEAEGIPRLRLYWLIQVREAVKEVLGVQMNGGSDRELSKAQKYLENTYNIFVSRYDWLNSVGNRRVFADDPEYPLLLALENYDADAPQKTTKTDIFSKRTIQTYQPKTYATSAKEALIYSLSEKGCIDIEFMVLLREQDASTILQKLQQDKLIYEDPNTSRWTTADEYLSGDVRSKLTAARLAAESEERFATNVEALEKVQPPDLLPGDIYVRLGSPWIPTQVIEDFIKQTLNVETQTVRVYHSKATATWSVEVNSNVLKSQNNTKIFGTNRVTADRLIELALNMKVPIVRDKVAENQYVENVEATRQAQNKQENLKELFKRWIWSDLARADQSARIYNEKYNCLVPRRFDGSHMELPGMNPEWRKKLRSHQLNAIWRIVASGNTLLGHAVGAGKTSEAIAASQELKRLGICYKPCLIVMDHLPEQVASEAIQMYPRLRLLIAGSAEMEASKRRELCARIATGDWDLIVISHTVFSKLPLRPETVRQFLEEESALVEADYLEAKSNGKRTKGLLKNLENKLNRLEQEIKTVATSQSKDNTVYFEDLGLDWLFYDESQQVKRLELNTKLNRVLGVPQGGSYRAKDFFMKTRYMSYQHGPGKGITLLTGTPITNTLAEAWVNQVYLQYETLAEMNLLHFDAWVSNFAEIKIAAEITAQGTLEVKNRLAVFNNLPEWRQLFWQVADIVSDKELNLPKPAVKYVTVDVPATPEQVKFFSHVAHRAEAIKEGKVEPTQDNMPLITTHIRQGVVDLRLLSSSTAIEFLTPEEIKGLDNSYTKVHRLIDNVFRIWQETSTERLTQLIFSDVGTPKNESGRFSVYEFIKVELLNRGVPSNEIAFIHDANTDEQKAALFRSVRFGKIRIFLGSTSKMGVGTNVQNYVIAAHDLDCPLRPSDLTQRAGRSVRQGNINPKVTIYQYVTQGKPYQDAQNKKIMGLSPDGYLYQTCKTKAEFIEDALNGRNTARSIEDCTDIVLSYAEVMATATGDPRLMRKVELDTLVMKLSQEERDHINTQISIRRDLERLPSLIELSLAKVADHQADIESAISTKGDKFQITLQTPSGKMTLGKRADAGQFINEMAESLLASGNYGTFSLGNFGGFSLLIEYPKNQLLQKLNHESEKCLLYLVGKATYSTLVKETALGTISSLEWCLSTKIEEELKKAQKSLQGFKQDFEALLAQKDKPFSKLEQLQAAIKEQTEINKELGLYKDDTQVINAEDQGQEAA